MFRRFFQRDGQGRGPGSQEPEQADKAKSPRLSKQAAQFLEQKDDGVHRHALRAGNEELPDDPDEQAYAGDEGEHAKLAQSALQADDFRRSIYHLALALADDPARAEWLALLDQWTAAVGTHALDLVPLYDKQYFATIQAAQQLTNRGNKPGHRMEVMPIVGKDYHAKVAVHAYILAAQGNTKEAVTLLLRLLQVKPEIPYVLWLTHWQHQAGFVDALTPEQVIPIVIGIIQKYPGVYVFSEQGRLEIQRYLPLIRAMYTHLNEPPGENVFMAGFAYATALRKAGAFEEAVRVARELPATSYRTQVPLAMAEEALGNFDASVAAYQQALTLEPNDVAVRNDLGTLFLHYGRLAESLAYSEESLRFDRSDPYQQAEARVAYLHYLQEQEPASEKWLEKLQSLAKHQRSAHMLMYFLQAPYIGKLPVPGEALINLMRNFKTKDAQGEIHLKAGGKTSVRLSSLEAPSARLASEMMLNALGVNCEISVSETLSPDPRQPLRPVEYQIWRYHDMDPSPAVAPPDPAIAESIAEIARQPYALERWYALARPLSQRLGAAALTSLLGVMVHPPATPVDWDAWDWLIAIQLASALTIAELDTGWEGSLRKKALTSLIYGPMDWSGAAALAAVAVLARQDKRINIEFDQICCDLWHFGRGSAEWPHEQAMVFGLHFVENFSHEAQAHINAYFERIQQERGQEEA